MSPYVPVCREGVPKICQIIAKLEAKVEKVGLELMGKILRPDRKFTIMFIILFFTLILVNQNVLEFLLKVLGVIK